MPKVSSSRGWWRAFFIDHPRAHIKDPSSSCGSKMKVYCAKCFNQDIADSQVADEQEVAQLRRNNVRSREQIEEDRKCCCIPVAQLPVITLPFQYQSGVVIIMIRDEDGYDLHLKPSVAICETAYTNQMKQNLMLV